MTFLFFFSKTANKVGYARKRRPGLWGSLRDGAQLSPKGAELVPTFVYGANEIQ